MVNRAVWAGRARSPTVGGMVTTLAQYQKTRPRHRPVPWSPRAWRQALYLAGGIPALLAAPVLVAVGFAAHPPRRRCRCCSWSSCSSRCPRSPRCSGTGCAPRPGSTSARRQRPWTKPGLVRYARSPATWRQLGYHLLAAPLLAAAALAALGHVAGGRRVHPGLRLRVDAAPGEPAGPRPVVAAGATCTARLPIPLDVYLTAGRDRAARGGAAAHRRGRGPGRQGRLGPCWAPAAPRNCSTGWST